MGRYNTITIIILGPAIVSYFQMFRLLQVVQANVLFCFSPFLPLHKGVKMSFYLCQSGSFSCAIKRE